MSKYTFLVRIFLFLSVISLNFNTFSAWYTQNSGVSDHLTSVYFINSNTGFACGEAGVMLKTLDKGTIWTNINSGTTANLYSVKFLNSNFGFACGDNIIIKTNDGGITWQSYTNSITASLRAVYIVDELTAFACGYDGLILKTKNAGNSWSILHSAPNERFQSIYFLNSNTGYASGQAGLYKKTTDGGLTWNSKQTDASKNFYTVQFVNPLRGFIIGGWHSSTIMCSNDEGENWENLLGGATGVRLFSGSFLNENDGYVCGRYGTIMKTNNSGEVWSTETSNVTSHLNSIQFINEQASYAVGDNGVIISTVSVIGINQISANIPKEFSIEQNYPNPFNPVTKIRFSVPASSFVNIAVYNMLGEKVNQLVSQQLSAGIYETDMNAAHLSSGTYFYTISAGDFRQTKKMILVK